MSALKLPRAYSISVNNRALTKRLGVRFNGVDRPNDVASYDMDKGEIRLTNGDVLHGTVEPYWR